MLVIIWCLLMSCVNCSMYSFHGERSREKLPINPFKETTCVCTYTEGIIVVLLDCDDLTVWWTPAANGSETGQDGDLSGRFLRT